MPRFFLKIKSFFRTLGYFIKIAVLWVQHRWWAIAGLSVLVLVLWGSAFYFIGYTTLKYQVQSIYNTTFLPQDEQGESEEWQIFSQLNMIMNQVKLLERTIDNLNTTLSEKENVISDLREQLYFYRAIVSPKDLKKGISIFSVKLDRPYQKGGFPFEIILRSHGKKNILHKGSLRISLSDKDSGNAKRLAMKTFYKGDSEFSFRYYQRLQGVIDLPDGFSPVKLSVRLVQKKKPTITEDWYWGDLLGGKHAHK